MIFTKKHLEMIRKGKKTETRRIWKVPHVKVGGEYGTRTSRREKEAGNPRIRVIEMHKELLRDMCGMDAIHEGCESLDRFKGIWEGLHGEWDEKQEVTVIRFEVVE